LVEGVLFRHVIELAAAKNELPYRTFSDRELTQIPKHVVAMRAEAGAPWRKDEDEQLAAAAAWMVLLR
jgi:hypothetical protein